MSFTKVKEKVNLNKLYLSFTILKLEDIFEIEMLNSCIYNIKIYYQKFLLTILHYRRDKSLRSHNK